MGNHAIELVNSLGDHWASWMGAAVIDSICLLPLYRPFGGSSGGGSRRTWAMHYSCWCR